VLQHRTCVCVSLIGTARARQKAGHLEATAVQIRKMTTRYQSALEVIFPHASTLFVKSVPMAWLVLSPLAVIAGVLGAWRLGSDAGWTSEFFIGDGLLSRYQLWFVIAVAAQASVLILDRCMANQNKAAGTVFMTGDLYKGRLRELLGKDRHGGTENSET
jgi:hypothetical protein